MCIRFVVTMVVMVTHMPHMIAHNLAIAHNLGTAALNMTLAVEAHTRARARARTLPAVALRMVAHSLAYAPYSLQTKKQYV